MGEEHTSNLDHVQPANSILVTALHGLQSAVIWADGGLGRKTAHSQEHVEDVGKTLGLIVVIGGTLVERPL